VPTAVIALTLAMNNMLDAMVNNNRMFWNFGEAMMHDTFDNSYA
jgi:hypothetical protein